MKISVKTVWEKLNRLLVRLDGLPLWLLGGLLMAVTFAPYAILGKGSIIPVHDQLDETILTYVLNAKYLGTGAEVFPEMMGGVNVSGMQPSAVLFVLLYRLFPVFQAFLIQYGIVFAAGFLGMYFCVREITGSSILACVTAGCFSILPFQPVYGLSVAGVPLILYCFLCLQRRKHIWQAFLLILFFGLTTHLILIGYAVLGLWTLAILWAAVRKKPVKLPLLGGTWLLLVYIAVNHRLFLELLLGQGSYVSHREEQLNAAVPFWETVWNMFRDGVALHAQSCHTLLILPILVLLLAGAFWYRRMDKRMRRRYIAAAAGMATLAGIAVFYGVCQTAPVVEFQNRCSGFLRYFQMDRFYWLYPAGWYLEFALCFSLWWGSSKEEGAKAAAGFFQAPALKLAALALLLLPTLQVLKVNSYFYLNVNQINNGSGITGYISWESFYAEDLMQELEDAIGKDIGTYRIAHVGINPAPALIHGFYTVDGYSNNYPLEYKHRFRKVIERELEKAPETAGYFDTWGSRCYLFNAESGNAWMLGKDKHIVYKGLEYDMEELKALGGEYLFSCGEILNAEELGITLLGYYETETSYWGVWLYEID